MPVIAIVRPGRTEYDEQDRIQGALNLPLSEAGAAQTTQIVDQLRDLPIDQIYASPTEPALSTARTLGDALGLPVKEVDALANVDHGLWQGLCRDEIKLKQPKVYKQWREHPDAVCPPKGETSDEAFERAQLGLKKILKRKAGSAIVCMDPMATLIESILRGEDPRMPTPASRNGQPLVELVEVSPNRQLMPVVS